MKDEPEPFPLYDDVEPITLSPMQEENFRRNLDDLLKKLDTETQTVEAKERQKIKGLENRKNLYLQHAEEMGKKSKGT